MSESPTSLFVDNLHYNQTPVSAPDFFSSNERYALVQKIVNEGKQENNEAVLQQAQAAKELADVHTSSDIAEVANLGMRLDVVRDINPVME